VEFILFQLSCVEEVEVENLFFSFRSQVEQVDKSDFWPIFGYQPFHQSVSSQGPKPKKTHPIISEKGDNIFYAHNNLKLKCQRINAALNLNLLKTDNNTICES